MRLMCPNCEAQYEVSDSVIPLHGRDVQCSNCGQTWFQTHPQSQPEAVDEDDTDFGGADSLPNVAAGSWDASDAETDDQATIEPDTDGAEPESPHASESPAPEAGTSFPPDPDAPQPAAAEHEASDAGEPVFEPAPADEPLPEAESHPLATAAEAVAPETQVTGELPEAEDDFDDAAPMAGDETLMAAVGTVAAAAALEPKRRSLDEAVLSVLREEAEREAKARRAAGGVETQTDMNLPAAEPAPRPNAGLDSLPKLRVQPQAESHVADLSTGGPRRPVEDLSQPIEDLSQPITPETADAPAALRQSRRDLLPDIEAFSSSLQADGGKAAAAAVAGDEPRPARRSGFRTGFLLVILLAVLVFGLYAAAPALGSRFPAAVPVLTQFVATVDKGRILVDQLMQSSLDQLKGDEKPAE